MESSAENRTATPRKRLDRPLLLDALRAIKELAAEGGVDGVCSIVCAPPGTIGAGSCSGVGYRRALR